MKKEPSTGKPANQHPEFLPVCASKCEFTGNKHQTETVAQDRVPVSAHSFPVVLQSRTWSKGPASFRFCSGLGFTAEVFTPLWDAPRQGVGSRYPRACAGWLPTLTAEQTCQFELLEMLSTNYIQDIGDSCCKDNVSPGYLFQQGWEHLHQLKELFLALKWPKSYIYNEGS